MGDESAGDWGNDGGNYSSVSVARKRFREAREGIKVLSVLPTESKQLYIKNKDLPPTRKRKMLQNL